MIQVFRSATQSSASFDRYSELCRECAKKEVENGFYVEYDLYLSEITDLIGSDDECDLCHNDFFVDGIEHEKVKGVVY